MSENCPAGGIEDFDFGYVEDAACPWTELPQQPDYQTGHQMLNDPTRERYQAGSWG
jgi:hypothetical protein